MREKLFSTILIISIVMSFLYGRPVFAGGVHDVVSQIFDSIAEVVEAVILTPIIVAVNEVVGAVEVVVAGVAGGVCLMTDIACNFAKDTINDAKCRMVDGPTKGFLFDKNCIVFSDSDSQPEVSSKDGCGVNQCSYKCLKNGRLSSCCGGCPSPETCAPPDPRCTSCVYPQNPSCPPKCVNPNDPGCPTVCDINPNLDACKQLSEKCEINPDDIDCTGSWQVSTSDGGGGGGDYAPCTSLTFSGINSQGHNYAIVRDGVIIAQLPASQTSFTDYNLKPHTKYDYKVRIPYPEEVGFKTSDSASISGTYTTCFPRCGFGTKNRSVAKYGKGILIWECENNNKTIDGGTCLIQNLRTGEKTNVDSVGGSFEVMSETTTNYALSCLNVDGSINLQDTIYVFEPSYKEVKP